MGRPARLHEPPTAFKVVPGLHILEATALEQEPHGIGLIVVMLKQQPPPGSQGPWSLQRNCADRFQAIETTIEGETGLVKTHHRIQALDLGGGDVRRIAHDQLQTPPPGLQSTPPRTEVKRDPILHLADPQILVGLGEGLRTAIHGVSQAAGEKAGQGKREATRASAEVGPVVDPSCREARGHLLRQIREQFGFLARDQHVRAHLDLQIPPGASPNEILQGNVIAAMAPPKIFDLPERNPQSDQAIRIQPQALQS